ncbi:unnamed protein product [Schistosoma margrebowiei]|uniref:Uncharacterized protein n=1 Tax=Schistosoma margrebowiei TaxID=48269 RepID=A0A183LL16_9TREM|nr:unnamed protein product [Schistosoma margrebowiei]
MTLSEVRNSSKITKLKPLRKQEQQLIWVHEKWEHQSNSNGNEEIQLSSIRNQLNQSDPSWTVKARHERDAAVLQSPREKCSTHTIGRSDPVQRSKQCTFRTGISRIQDH